MDTQSQESRPTRPAVLLIMGSHGFPPTRARFARLRELARELTLHGVIVDSVLLCEKPLLPFEEEELKSSTILLRELEIVQHPKTGSFFSQVILKATGALALKPQLGGRLHCPARLLQVLAQKHVERGYRAVIAGGAHLTRVLGLFAPEVLKVVDLGRIGHDAHASHALQGRADVFPFFESLEQELDLLSQGDVVMVSTAADAVRLRQLGHTRDLLHAPPIAGAWTLQAAGAPSTPIRPPRILFIGSDTASNLDGIRWFRRLVFPRILSAVPTCRLRLVGESARHIEPGPNIDRIGWVRQTHEEYRDAACVVLPLRMASGFHRRLVEAFSWGKAVVATPEGVTGLPDSFSDALLVAREPEALASAAARVLTSDVLRRRLEVRSLEVARTAYAAPDAFRPLVEWLQLRGTRAAAPRIESFPVQEPALA